MGWVLSCIDALQAEAVGEDKEASTPTNKVCLHAHAAAAAAPADPQQVLPERKSASAAHLLALGHVILLVVSGLYSAGGRES